MAATRGAAAGRRDGLSGYLGATWCAIEIGIARSRVVGFKAFNFPFSSQD